MVVLRRMVHNCVLNPIAGVVWACGAIVWGSLVHDLVLPPQDED